MTTLKTFAVLSLLIIAIPVHAQNSFYSQSTSSNSKFSSNNGLATFEFRQTPLRDVLMTMGVGATPGVYVDETVGDALDMTVSYKAEDTKISTAVASLLKAAKLRLVKTDKGLVISATKADEKITTKVTSLNARSIAKQLDRQVPLMMMHTPLEMVVQFAGGMSGLDIHLDRLALRKARISPQMLVSIDSGNDSIGDALEKMLKPHGLTLKVEEGLILVTTASKKSAAELR